MVARTSRAASLSRPSHVDGRLGAITDTHATPEATVRDSIVHLGRPDRQGERFGFAPAAVGLDAGYATAAIAPGLEPDEASAASPAIAGRRSRCRRPRPRRAAPADGRVALVAPVAQWSSIGLGAQRADQAGDESRSPQNRRQKPNTTLPTQYAPENRGICQQSGAPTEIGAPFDFNQSWATMNADAGQRRDRRRQGGRLQSRTTSTRQGPWLCCRRAR